jgi:hypothetical protein
MRSWRYWNQDTNAIVVFVSEVDSTRFIYRDPDRKADFRINGWPAVSAEPVCAVPCNRGDKARRRVNPPYPVIDRICDIKVPFGIGCRSLGMIQRRILG